MESKVEFGNLSKEEIEDVITAINREVSNVLTEGIKEATNRFGLVTSDCEEEQGTTPISQQRLPSSSKLPAAYQQGSFNNLLFSGADETLEDPAIGVLSHFEDKIDDPVSFEQFDEGEIKLSDEDEELIGAGQLFGENRVASEDEELIWADDLFGENKIASEDEELLGAVIGADELFGENKIAIEDEELLAAVIRADDLFGENKFASEDDELLGAVIGADELFGENKIAIEDEEPIWANELFGENKIAIEDEEPIWADELFGENKIAIEDEEPFWADELFGENKIAIEDEEPIWADELFGENKIASEDEELIWADELFGENKIASEDDELFGAVIGADELFGENKIASEDDELLRAVIGADELFGGNKIAIEDEELLAAVIGADELFGENKIASEDEELIGADELFGENKIASEGVIETILSTNKKIYKRVEEINQQMARLASSGGGGEEELDEEMKRRIYLEMLNDVIKTYSQKLDKQEKLAMANLMVATDVAHERFILGAIQGYRFKESHILTKIQGLPDNLDQAAGRIHKEVQNLNTSLTQMTLENQGTASSLSSLVGPLKSLTNIGDRVAALEEKIKLMENKGLNNKGLLATQASISSTMFHTMPTNIPPTQVTSQTSSLKAPDYFTTSKTPSPQELKPEFVFSSQEEKPVGIPKKISSGQAKSSKDKGEYVMLPSSAPSPAQAQKTPESATVPNPSAIEDFLSKKLAWFGVDLKTLKEQIPGVLNNQIRLALVFVPNSKTGALKMGMSQAAFIDRFLIELQNVLSKSPMTGISSTSASKESKMEGRKWEELNTDCLVNVFGRVGMESLLLDIPFVCKSWYKATLNPLCWERLVFPSDCFTPRLIDEYQQEGIFCSTSFIKFVVNRSRRSATSLVLPSCWTEEVLVYIADKCPALKFLALPYDLFYDQSLTIPDLISKWKKLEMLRLGRSNNMEEILAQISLHCKNFVGLAVTGAYIGKDEASAIVTLLPKIKYLVLRQASLERENLAMILQGCKELVFLDVSDCIGFKGDDEILKLASHISTFKYDGSRVMDDDDYWEYEDYRDDDVYDGYYSN